MGKIIKENGVIWLEEVTENYGSKSIKRTRIGEAIEENEKPKKTKRKRTT
jgi:hypothetical protein